MDSEVESEQPDDSLTMDTEISTDNEQENRPSTTLSGIDASGYSFDSENNNSDISVADPEECAGSLVGCDDSEPTLGACDNDNTSLVNSAPIEHHSDVESDSLSCCSCEDCQFSCSRSTSAAKSNSDMDSVSTSYSCESCHSLDAGGDVDSLSNHSTAITNSTSTDHSISLSSKDDCSCKEASFSDCDWNSIDSTQQNDGDSFTHVPTRSTSFTSVNIEDRESSDDGDRRSVITNSNSDSSLCSYRHYCLHRNENGSCCDCSCGSSWTGSDSDSCCSCDCCYSDTSNDETD